MPHFGTTQDPDSSDPIVPTPMVIDVDRIDPYDRNPRRERNAAYDDIRASIRARGLDHPLTITRRPDAENYMVEAGGNTRLMILKELWRETGEERFLRVHCLFRPWVSEVNVLAAHLVENETRGELVFIDKALGVRDLRHQLGQETGEELSLRRFSEALGELGYRVSKSLLSVMDYAVDVLLPLIPQALRAGMGRPRIQGIRRIEFACRGYWRDRDAVMAEFDALFADALSSLDADRIDVQTVQETIESRMANLLDIPINHVRLDLDARLFQGGDGPDEGNEASTATTKPAPRVTRRKEPAADSCGAAAGASPHNDAPAGKFQPARASAKPGAAEHPTRTPTPASRDLPEERQPLPSDLKSLRSRAYVLGLKLARRHGLDDLILPMPSLGLGFWIEVPEAPLASGSPPTVTERFRCWVWWWLLAMAEVFLDEHATALPETALIRHVLLTGNHELVVRVAGTPVLPFPVAEFLTHPEADERDVDDLWQLAQACRQIHRVATEEMLWTAS